MFLDALFKLYNVRIMFLDNRHEIVLNLAKCCSTRLISSDETVMIEPSAEIV